MTNDEARGNAEARTSAEDATKCCREGGEIRPGCAIGCRHGGHRHGCQTLDGSFFATTNKQRIDTNTRGGLSLVQFVLFVVNKHWEWKSDEPRWRNIGRELDHNRRSL